ncbi:MAG: ribbon-helix-helix domain-containing protein [Acidobacteriia bacterium]|nr:ribbon-helix-helix domain-containing protein [Terriglobia bacterium]
MRESSTFTVSLPPAMARQIKKAMKAEHRTRSELVREALRVYFNVRMLPAERPTAAEARAYRRGMAAYKRGDYVTLGDYVNGMDRSPRRAGKKVS